MKEKPVFSTKPSPATQQQGGDKKQEKLSPLASGPIKMRLESKGRGGKTVTVLFNLPLTTTEAAAMARELQNSFGVGGTFKDGVIELRGDLRDKVEAYSTKKGLKVVRAGG